MNPGILMTIWSLICISLLAFIILKIVKFIKFRKGKTIVFFFALFFVSCSKESARIDQMNIAGQIGFNLKTINKSPSVDSKLEPLVFKTMEEARIYFKPFLERKSSVFKKDPVLDSTLQMKNSELMVAVAPSDSTVTLTEIYVISGYTVSFTWHTGGNTSGGGNLSAFGFSSGLAGVTLGCSWIGGTSSYINYPNSALIYFTSTGIQNYNIIVEGLGTVFSQPVVINGIYNTNTRGYSMSVSNPE